MATVPIDTATLEQLRAAAVNLLKLTSRNGTEQPSAALFAAVERIEKERAAWELAQAVATPSPEVTHA